MTVDENLQILEDSIRRLKIEYDIFFAGAVRKPPYDLRNRVDSLLKRLLDEKKMTLAQRYRFNTLMARYSSYRDLWRRLVQSKELDLPPEPVTAAPELGASETTYPKAPALPTPSRSESIRIQISDPALDTAKVQELYRFVTSAQTRLGEKKVLPFENFCALIRAKTDKLKETTQCRCVTFSVSIEDDKVKFTAKASDV